MNCEKANKDISIRRVLNALGYKEQRKKGADEGFYFAIDRVEKDASLLVNYTRNFAHDFSNGRNYSVVDVVCEVKSCSVSDALKYLDSFSFELTAEEKRIFAQRQNKNKPKIKEYQITTISKVKHLALIEYLKSRKIWEQRDKLKEIHYDSKGKNYFGVGFENDLGNFEVSSKYGKIALGEKSITYIHKTAKLLRVFEGFMDYLSFCEFNPNEENTSSYIILNSTSLWKQAIPYFGNYEKVELYLDNDKTGNEKTAAYQTYFYFVSQKFIEDMRYIYANYNDYNDFIKNKKIVK